ncbi:MAG: hypothetical protein LBR53_02120, partial [Deltaproteobacteria bacterium]|nr:hypothetical protein [Deltaproteobacteria bacterium]
SNNHAKNCIWKSRFHSPHIRQGNPPAASEGKLAEFFSTPPSLSSRGELKIRQEPKLTASFKPTHWFP